MEQLLSVKEVSRRLGISTRTFWRYRPRMVARGLVEVCSDHRKLYREADVDRFIRKAAETGLLVTPCKQEETSCQK